MSITRWDPFRDLHVLRERMNRLFEDSISQVSGSEELGTVGWMPVVDVFETENSVVLKAEVPEVNKEDVDIQVRDGVLTIRGERRFQNEANKDRYQRIERSYGAFQRSFTLPPNVDSENVQARMKDGVLTIEIVKKEDTKPRQIKIGIEA